MRLPLRLLRKRIATTLLVVFALVSGALAYFTTLGSGSANGSVTTLSAPASPAASASGTTATITWNASTIGGTVAASSYSVERYNSTGTDLGAASCSPVSSSSGNPNALGSFTCSDSPGGGSFEYKITARYHSSWTATTAFTNTVSVQSSTSTSASGPATDATNTAIPTTSISSTLSGAGTGATGTITFKVFGPQASAPTTCTSGGTTVGTATVSGNATYHPSAAYTPTSAGTYWWYVSYGGDSGDTASASTCGSGMSSTVVKNAPAATASAPATGNAGTAIAASSISSALSGASAGATGTITFTVFGPQATAPSTCTSGGTTVGTATVLGNATYNPSAGYTPSTVGTYWWYASYNGDSSNSAASSTCGSGMASTVVGKSSAPLTAGAPGTAATGTPIGSGSISATLSGATSGATGTITFTVFGPQATAPTTCTSGGTTVGTASVSGNATYHPSAGYTPSSAGTYWWYVSYGGDSNNNSSNSTCGTGMTSTAVTNTSSILASGPATGTSGTAIATGSISATLSGATSGATGTITFTVFGPQTTAPSSCTSGGTTVGTATVSGNATYHPSAAFTPSSAGVYWWYASYGGDSNNSSSSSLCGSPIATTYVWSVSSAANATSTSATNNTATSSFTVQPSTTYLLLVFRHSTAGDGISSISSAGLSPALNTASFTSVASQSYNSVEYQWAYYVTTASNASGTGTLTVNFTNTLGSGQVTVLDLIALGGNSTANPVVVGNVGTANGSSATATANLPNAPGSVDSGLVFLTASKGLGASAPAESPAMTNQFYSQQGPGSMSVYSATPASQNESATITSAPWGTIALELRRAGSANGTTTTASAPATGSAASPIAAGSISSTLSGAAAGAIGTITFTVFGPQASAPTTCTSGGTTVGTATVSGNGTYNPSAGYTPSTSGTYWWYATYSGDADNLFSSSTCGSGMGSTVVGNATPMISAAGPSAALAASAISASSITSTLSNGVTPSGTITYKVFGPQATAPTTCTSGGTTVGTSSVSGNGSYSSSASFTPLSTGTYWWYASYGGDSNNSAAASTCGTGMPATYVYSATSVASVTDTASANNSTTSSFTVQPSTTYLLLVYRSKSGAGDGLTSLSSTGLSPALTLPSFTSIASQSFNSKDYQWAYWITTAGNASGTGTLTLNFTNTLGAGQVTIIDLVALGGVSATAPVVTSNEVTTSANTGTATANLPNAPASGDLGFVLLGSEKGLGATVPSPSPAMTNIFYSQQGPGSMAPYIAAPGVQNESISVTAAFWGTIGFELTHP